MTWRIFFFALFCSAAALVVATAASSGSTGEGPPEVQPVMAMQTLSTPVPESTRLVALVFGMGAVLLTYQQAWRNLRRRS